MSHKLAGEMRRGEGRFRTEWRPGGSFLIAMKSRHPGTLPQQPSPCRWWASPPPCARLLKVNADSWISDDASARWGWRRRISARSLPGIRGKNVLQRTAGRWGHLRLGGERRACDSDRKNRETGERKRMRGLGVGGWGVVSKRRINRGREERDEKIWELQRDLLHITAARWNRNQRRTSGLAISFPQTYDRKCFPKKMGQTMIK